MEFKHDVLVVDDSSYNLFVIQELISAVDKAIHVDTALNGVQALEKVREKRAQGGSYTIIFMDLSMPIMDGYQVRLALS